MFVWKEIKRLTSRDGRRRVIIESNAEGLFKYHEDTLVTEDGYTWWNPSYGSGLYDSAEAVEGDARAERSWLQEPE